MWTFSIDVPILRWSAWAPGIESVEAWRGWFDCGAEPLSGPEPGPLGIDPMQLRRLSSFSRMALHVLQKCAGDCRKFQLVFASRHGDLVRSLVQLRELARGEFPSPAVFSMLVHNAVPGIARILRRDHEPATAVAAGSETFGYGLIEALGRLAVSRKEPVILVYADQPIPAEYAADVGGPEVAHSVALMLGRTGDEQAAERIVMETDFRSVAAEADTLMQSLAFLRVLTGSTEISSWRGGRGQWRWRRP